MFDFAWSEFALIGVVALIAIGPKDMPVAIKTVAQMIKKARRMAGEFQTHVDEMLRDADLQDVKSQISEIRNFDFKGTIERAVDSDGSIRKTFTEDPLRTTSFAAEPVAPDPVAAGAPAAAHDAAAFGSAGLADTSVLEPVAAPGQAEATDGAPGGGGAPAFIPPAVASPPRAPAFIPPAFQLGGPRGGGRRVSA